MKKIALTFVIIFGMTFSATSQMGGGFFNRGDLTEQDRDGYTNAPLLPEMHGETNDQPADSGSIGTGVALLAGLGVAYLVGKKRKDD